MTVARLFFALLWLGASACDDSARCDELRDELLELIRAECPAGSSCKGNPTLDKPTVRFSQGHYDLLREMEELGCDPPDLGQAPWFCNSGGEPVCPTGYTCCFESLSDVCRRACVTGDAGSSGG